MSRWELTLAGQPLSLLKSGDGRLRLGRFFLTNPDLPGLRREQRRRAAAAPRRGRRLRADQRLQHALRAGRVRAAARAAAPTSPTCSRSRDVVRDRSASIVNGGAVGGRSLRFRYQVPGFLAETTIRVERSEIVGDRRPRRSSRHAPPRIDGTDVVWEVELPPRCLLTTLVKVGVPVNNAVVRAARTRRSASGWSRTPGR